MSVASKRSGRSGLGNPTASAYLRLAAAGTIVLFHASPASPLGVSGAVGLAVFLYLAFVSFPKPSSPGAVLKRSAEGLLVPWAFWWLFYAMIKAYIAGGIPPFLGPDTDIWLLLQGPAIHLWFLPFLFIMMNSVNLIRGALMPLSASFKIVAALSMAVCGLIYLIDRSALPAPFSQMVNALPSVGLGLAYLWVLRTLDRKMRTMSILLIALVVAIVCVPIWLYGNKYVAVGYIGGSLAMLLLNVRWPRSRLVLRWSLLSMGIYLIHPFAITCIYKFFGADVPTLLLATSAFLLSSGATWILLQFRWTRSIVLP